MCTRALTSITEKQTQTHSVSVAEANFERDESHNLRCICFCVEVSGRFVKHATITGAESCVNRSRHKCLSARETCQHEGKIVHT